MLAYYLKDYPVEEQIPLARVCLEGYYEPF